MARLLAALSTTFLSHSAIVVATLMIPVLAPQLAALYGIDGKLIGLYSSMVYLVSFVSALASVDLIARVGPIRVISGSLALTALGLTVLYVHAWQAIFVAAIFFGLSFGPSNPTSSVLLAKMSPPRLRGRVFSIKQCAVPLGGFFVAAIAPSLFSWVGGNGVVSAALALCLLVLALVLVLRPVIADGEAGATRLCSLRETVTAIAVIVFEERLRKVALMSLGFASVQFTFSAVSVLVLVDYAGFHPTEAGAVFSAVMVLSIVCRILLGWLGDIRGARFVMIAIALLLALISFAYPFLLGQIGKPATAFLTILYGGICFGWNGVALSMLADYAPHEKVGAATAGTMAMSLVGGAGGPALFTFLLTATGTPTAGYLALGACALASLILSVRLPR